MEGNLPTKPTQTLTATLTSAIIAGYCLGFDGAFTGTAGEPPMGIAQMDGVIGDAVPVDTDGLSQGICSEAIATKGAELACANDGRFKVAASGEFIFARAMSATSAAGQKLQVLITREGVKA